MTARQRNRATALYPPPPPAARPGQAGDGRSGHWADHGACTITDPDLFFSDTQADTEKAKRICGGCPSRPDCLSYALTNGISDGVWGGLTGHERQAALSGGVKACKGCGATKPLSDYHRHTSTSDRRDAYCKACARVRDAARTARKLASRRARRAQPTAALQWPVITSAHLDDARRRRDAGETLARIATDLGTSRQRLARHLAGSRQPVPDQNQKEAA